MAISRRFDPRQRETGKRLRVNDFIRISPIRLIDENNEQIGVVDLDEAKRRAREAELDLVEVSPNSTPPVCRIMDYGKWKYSQKKKEQKARSHTKQSELKGIRLRPKIDPHDLEIKTNHAKEFLQEGHKVQFTMIFRGREMAHRDLALQQMQKISDILVKVSKIEAAPRMMGRRMTMVLAPDRGGGKPSSGAGEGAAPAPTRPAAAPAPAPAPAPAAPRPADATAP